MTAPAGEGPAIPSAEATPPSRSSPTLGRLLIGGLVFLVVVDRVGLALTPYLAPRHPLVMVGLDSSDRSLILAVHVGLVPFVVVAVLRRLVGQTLYYLVGWHLGDSARAWVHRWSSGRALARIETVFRRASLPVILAMPREIICLLAGDTRVPFPVFIGLAAVRDLAAALLLRLISRAFASEVEGVLRLLGRYTLWATLLAVLVGLAVVARRRRSSPPPADADGRARRVRR